MVLFISAHYHFLQSANISSHHFGFSTGSGAFDALHIELTDSTVEIHSYNMTCPLQLLFGFHGNYYCWLAMVFHCLVLQSILHCLIEKWSNDFFINVILKDHKLFFLSSATPGLCHMLDEEIIVCIIALFSHLLFQSVMFVITFR